MCIVVTGRGLSHPQGGILLAKYDPECGPAMQHDVHIADDALHTYEAEGERHHNAGGLQRELSSFSWRQVRLGQQVHVRRSLRSVPYPTNRHTNPEI